MARQTGKCCMGDLCTSPNMQLCPEHTCPKCNQIVHILCGVFDTNTDKFVCNRCYEHSKLSVGHDDGAKAANDVLAYYHIDVDAIPPPPSPICHPIGGDDLSAPPPPQITTKAPNSKPKVRRCPSCGGTDHERKSSRRCPHNTKKKATTTNKTSITKTTTTAEKSKTNPTNISNTSSSSKNSSSTTLSSKNDCETATTTHDTSNSSGTTTTNDFNIHSILNEEMNLNSEDDSNSDDDDNEISKPNFINVQDPDDDPAYSPVIDVASSSFAPKPTVFKLFAKNHHGRSEPTTPTPSNLCDKYWSLTFINTIVKNSNSYRSQRKDKEPNLYY